MCRHSSNSANVRSCEICSFKAPRTKMGMKVNGRFVLMSVVAARPPEKGETLRLFDVSGDKWHNEVELNRASQNLEVGLPHRLHRPNAPAIGPGSNTLGSLNSTRARARPHTHTHTHTHTPGEGSVDHRVCAGA